MRAVTVGNSNEDSTLITEFVLMRTVPGLSPGEPGVKGDIKVTFFVGFEGEAIIAYAHDDAGGGGGEDGSGIVEFRFGVEVKVIVL